MLKIKERLEIINSEILAFNIILANLYKEKHYCKCCIENPSLDNLYILEEFTQKNNQFIEKLIKK